MWVPRGRWREEEGHLLPQHAEWRLQSHVQLTGGETEVKGNNKVTGRAR